MGFIIPGIEIFDQNSEQNENFSEEYLISDKLSRLPEVPENN